MNVNIFLFDDFNVMDAFGPAEIFGKLPEHFHINYLSLNGDFINSVQGVKVWTEPLTDEVTGILVVPGGRGARKVLYQSQQTLERVRNMVEQADVCLSVSEGSGYLAQTGALYRRNVAAYEHNENWKRMYTAAVQWIPNVTWVADGKFYSASKTIYGIDIALGAVADMIDLDAAMKAAKQMGYAWDSEEGYS